MARQKNRKIVEDFAGRFGVHPDVLGIWIALVATDLHVKADRLVNAIEALDSAPVLGSGSTDHQIKTSILHFAKRFGVDPTLLQAAEAPFTGKDPS